MGLVDYSDSESEVETQPSQPVKAAPASKTNSKPFQKFVDRSNPGKILVNLPTTSSAPDKAQPSDGPPAKRAKTAGGNRFSGFSSFLPPPKTAAKPAAPSAQSSSSGAKAAPRPGFHLKTGAEPAFSRDQPSDDRAWNDKEDYGEDGSTSGAGGGLKLPPPGNHSTGTTNGPRIPADQLPAEEVKLVGKPLMFKPLSVSRKPAKKKAFPPSWAAGSTAAKTPSATTKPTTPAAVQEEPPKKKASLFSIEADTPTPEATPTEANTAGTYEPLFTTSSAADPSYTDPYAPTHDLPPPQNSSSDLTSIANDLNLTPQARRELFGREGQLPQGAGARVVTFDMAREYEHNEAVRASGEAVTHNPVRSIKAGKHSLRQLVNAVQANAGALEESFASGKSKKDEAGARYGWR
jgi:hypothetical protein